MTPGEAAASAVFVNVQIASEQIDHNRAIKALRDKLAHIVIHAVDANGRTIENYIAGTDCFVARVSPTEVLMFTAEMDNYNHSAELVQFIGRVDPINTLYTHSLVQLGLISMADYELIQKVRSEIRNAELEWNRRQDYLKLKARYEPSAS